MINERSLIHQEKVETVHQVTGLPSQGPRKVCLMRRRARDKGKHKQQVLDVEGEGRG